MQDSPMSCPLFTYNSIWCISQAKKITACAADVTGNVHMLL